MVQATPISRSSRRRVLLVDDDLRTAKRLALMLEEDGYSVEVLGDGAAAMQRIEHEPRPDVIVTDVIMPRAGGIAVLGAARRRWRDLPVIFVTGHPELLMGHEVPFERTPTVLTKPISYADLNDTLARVVQAGGDG